MAWVLLFHLVFSMLLFPNWRGYYCCQRRRDLKIPTGVFSGINPQWFLIWKLILLPRLFFISLFLSFFYILSSLIHWSNTEWGSVIEWVHAISKVNKTRFPWWRWPPSTEGDRPVNGFSRHWDHVMIVIHRLCCGETWATPSKSAVVRDSSLSSTLTYLKGEERLSRWWEGGHQVKGAATLVHKGRRRSSYVRETGNPSFFFLKLSLSFSLNLFLPFYKRYFIFILINYCFHQKHYYIITV